MKTYAKPAPGNAKKPAPIFKCLECGKTFRSLRAAQNAVNHGCPRCGGSDIDVA